MCLEDATAIHPTGLHKKLKGTIGHPLRTTDGVVLFGRSAAQQAGNARCSWRLGVFPEVAFKPEFGALLWDPRTRF